MNIINHHQRHQPSSTIASECITVPVTTCPHPHKHPHSYPNIHDYKRTPTPHPTSIHNGDNDRGGHCLLLYVTMVIIIINNHASLELILVVILVNLHRRLDGRSSSMFLVLHYTLQSTIKPLPPIEGGVLRHMLSQILPMSTVLCSTSATAFADNETRSEGVTGNDWR